MALQIWLVFWPGFFLGILHTLLPCEDKAIFFFYTFGTSRDSKHAYRILMGYGFGLLCTNMLIGTFAAFGGLIFNGLNEHITNGFGAISIILSGFVMLFQNKSLLLKPHHQQGKDISESFKYSNGNFRNRTAFLLGVLAGIPPCVFELAIYTQALTFSASSGVLNGIFVVLFFGFGTWIGLFPLATFGLIAPAAKNYLSKKKIETGAENPNSENKNINQKSSLSKIELISAIILISLGFVFLILAILQINIFTWPEVPPI
jgi:sulfite exporter TauE/SafE